MNDLQQTTISPFALSMHSIHSYEIYLFFSFLICALAESHKGVVEPSGMKKDSVRDSRI